MNALQRRLYIQRTRFLDELCETEESLEFGGEGVEEGSGEDVHALDVGEAELVGLLTVWGRSERVR